jgi:hypothetical protein
MDPTPFAASRAYGPPWGGATSYTPGLMNKEERTSFLNNVLGDDASSLSSKIGKPGSPCWDYLQGIVDKLNISSIKSPQDLISALAVAQTNNKFNVMGDVTGPPWLFGGSAADFGQYGDNAAEVVTSNWIGTGRPDMIIFGWKFFNSSDLGSPFSILVHESFHLSGGGFFILGTAFGVLGDLQLFGAAGVNSAKEFNSQIDEHCK